MKNVIDFTLKINKVHAALSRGLGPGHFPFPGRNEEPGLGRLNNLSEMLLFPAACTLNVK